MIHHQNADAMVLASVRLRGIPSLDVHHFEYYQGGECLSNVHWLGPWRQHLMTNYRLCQNHRKIIGKTKKSAFCVPYSVPPRLWGIPHENIQNGRHSWGWMLGASVESLYCAGEKSPTHFRCFLYIYYICTVPVGSGSGRNLKNWFRCTPSEWGIHRWKMASSYVLYFNNFGDYKKYFTDVDHYITKRWLVSGYTCINYVVLY
jgi:hypothetical protein